MKIGISTRNNSDYSQGSDTYQVSREKTGSNFVIYKNHKMIKEGVEYMEVERFIPSGAVENGQPF